MRFRPCIDLHKGIVKQIVGSTLTDENGGILETNFQSEKPSEWFAELYRKDRLTGGHIIQLGSGNEKATQAALSAWPGGMQVGGGINIDNAAYWLDSGAGAVIVTSWVFHDGNIDEERLKSLVKLTGKEKLVLDLSCRRQGQSYKVVTNRWQTFTDEVISFDLLDYLSGFCSEFLIHAVDVEGKCSGIETALVELLGRWSGTPVTYAGGIRSMEDIMLIDDLGKGNIDFTVGSALDIFGGTQLAYKDIAKSF
ncbi:MAG: phosphoribosylformimino-5-aminoimidazole carboxamide ribotide isomerase [Desulfobacterales bacterium]|jgi:phosphoribosylformimino-5-aminoimidazole carboxamide ribotide isomerase|nr:phosphoribosylformimino-5-aminoimidazole carboxamide ribotide isomerase [Desulfobacteraceae bacterium]MBT4365703.1 phosphoribosylformimino-5-aminoimidazole carboxamide ribotide isomerase [Desulfobacteraceae bacterium]MBT7086069.1 phosphoribosylformimino-5-aminoimidazole carboxamide ribotide isomerase [Desulfobacterales bacterium]MBT7697304.1 phosphoribosylformimino-5-aminoimidazole carboxamide ribotide isomerase [Desulfobacterales bacterium]